MHAPTLWGSGVAGIINNNLTDQVMTRRIRSAAFCCALLLTVLSASAEEIRDYYAEPGLNPFKQSLNQHFNEHVDPFSGTLQLKYTDLSIPGNGGMDINVNRVYTSLQTNAYPTLGLNGLGWIMHFGRIVTSRNHADKLCSQGAFPLTTIENPSLEMPDGGRELLVLNHINNDNTLITRSNWRAQCGPSGVGLVVTSPEGTRYTMNQYDSFQGEPSWLTTRIEDLEGNWIRVEYKINAVGVSYIDAVYRSEEGDATPVVRYEYESPDTADIKLAAISANGQRVQYHYEVIPGYLYPYYEQLVEVVRPDGHSWEYQYHPKLGDIDPDDGVIEDGPGSYSLIHVAYPYGATIDYTYQYVQFDPGSSLKTTSIGTKVVSGSGVTGGTWTFTFAPFSFPYEDGYGGQLRQDVTTIAGPDDILRFYHYGKDFRAAIGGGNVFIRPSFVGLLAQKEIYTRSDTLLERTGYSWGGRLLSNEDFWHGAGYRSWWRDNGTYAPLLTAQYTSRDSKTSQATYSHYTQYFDYDPYGNPGRILTSSDLADRPHTQRQLTYFIDTAKWILHPVQDEVHQEVSGSTTRTIGEIERTYNDNGKLRRETAFGVERKFTYTSAGDIATVEDARGNIHRYSSYKRGIPRTQQLPESVTIERVVNDAGTVRSQTNGRGYTTRFEYDDLNRLKAIDFPIKGDVAVSYGSASGGYRRTLTRDGYRQTDVINDFGQLLRIERADTLSGEMIFRTNDYDASGRQTFTSYPNATAGITTTYDALGRIRRTQHPDATGVNYVYDDSVVQVTNERGFKTTYYYHTRGTDFGAKSIAFMRAPENVGTIIRKDSFDNTTQVFQGEALADDTVRGYGRDYEYDARQFLIRTTEPELGVTTYTHDAVGNVLSERNNDAEPVTFVYDNLNRRTRTDFPGATPDVVVGYDGNGNPQEIVKGTTRWAYAYDENDNLLSETLTIADPLFGTRSYATARQYNDLDILQQITYPSGLAIDYAPDAFGRATRAGTFATEVTFHPSGQLQSYRLANGVVANIALNQRLLPQSIQAGSLVNLSYTYDAGGNVLSIVDGLDSTRSVRMTASGSYDGLDRLAKASGSWGQARFTYDHMGNLTAKTVGADNLTHQYDGRLRLHQVRKINASNTSLDDARIRMDFDVRGNAVAKRRYVFDTNRNMTSLSDMRFVYDSDSTLIKAQVVNRTAAQATPLADKDYLYDGNGQRIVEKKHRTYDIRYSVHSRAGELLFEDSIADCTMTDYIRLGAMTLARSDDRRADPAVDSDGDTLNNCMELQLGLNPNDAADANADADGDGLSNLREFQLGSALRSGDTDGDGLTDAQEENQHHTDPTLADSDGDGLSDGAETVDSRTSPILADNDHDGVTDFWELQVGSNPEDPSDGRADSDGDGFSNRQESLLGFDPTLATKSPQRGLQAWRFETMGKVYSSAAIAPSGVVYVSADTEHIYAVNPDGTQRWRYSVPQSTLSAPALGANGTIYFVADGPSYTEIHAVNPDGTRRWVYQTDNYVSDGVALGPNGHVYYAGHTNWWESNVLKYAAKWEALDDTGQVVVSGAPFAESVARAPAVGVNGDVYLMTGSGELRAYTEQGALRWTVPTQGAGAAQAPVVASTQTIYFADTAGRTIAVSPQGQVLWTRQSPDNLTRSTVTIGSDGVLYIGAYDSKLYAVDPASGGTLWTANTAGTAYTPAIARDGTIYVTTYGGNVSAYDPAGTLLWTHDTDMEVSSPPAIDRDGMLYFGSRTGQLYAVVDNGGGLADTPWPMYRHDTAGSAYTCFNNAAFSALVDSDGDGIDNCSELKHGLDPSNPNDAALDLDGDGLSNSHEHANGTNISNPDTDADGLNDGQEVLTHHSDPRRADTDGDTIGDGREVQYGLNPLDAADALLDADGDGFSNRAESWAGSDPTQGGSRPALGTVASVIEGGAAGPRPRAIASDGTIYRIMDAWNGIEALDANFKLQWQRTLGENNHPPSLAADGTLYTLTENGQQLLALYPNGRDRWKYQVEQDGTHPHFYGGSPLVGADGTLFSVILGWRPGAQYNYHQIVAIDPRGRLKWRIETDYQVVAPAIALDRDGNVVAYAARDGATKYRGDNGQLIWRGSGGDYYSYSATTPVIDADNTIYVINYYGMHALRPGDGSTSWSYAASRTPVITPSGLILAACTASGQLSLCAITREGALAWTAPNAGYNEAVVGKNGVIYLTTSQGLFAYDQNGAPLWNVPAPAGQYSMHATILDDGMIYLSESNYRALIISDSFGLADSAWPTVNRDYKNSRSAPGVGREQPSAAPTIGITAPSPFRPLNLDVGEPFALTAYASDAVDGNLDGAIVWTSSLDGMLGQGATLNSPPLSLGAHVITASVTDANGLTALDTVTINLGYLPPTLAITAPIEGDVIERGQLVTLAGEADDAIDGDLGDSIQWSSDRDGAIGIGRAVATATLSPGQHAITAAVTDSSNTSATATVRISIEVRPPELYVWAPYDGGGYEVGTPIEFRANAYDGVDGDVSGGIEWRSDRDGLLYTGFEFTTSALSQGTHVVTVTARDLTGAETNVTLTLTIGPQPPGVWVPDGYTFTVAQGSNTIIEGTATDAIDGDLSSTIQWTSLLDGLIGSGASISTASLSGGEHAVTLSVTDSAGLTGTSQVSIYVDAWPNSIPAVSITSPANNAQFILGDAIRLQGNATDPEQGNIRSSIQWSSDLDGALGAGSPLTVRTLRVGDHTIKAMVTDNAGAKAAVTRTVRVRAQ